MRVSSLALLCFILSGCVRDGAGLIEGNSWSRLRPRLPSLTPDTVELHYIFIERELGNAAINQKIWMDADEQVIPLELKKQLNQNGLRIGKLGSRLAPEMLTLLEKSNATGEGRRHMTRVGVLAKIETTGVVPSWSLFTIENGAPRGDEFTDAQGYFNLTPYLAESNAVRVTFVPSIEHGPRKTKRTVAEDVSGWELRTERESKQFPDLATELVLESGEFVLLGCDPELRRSLGGGLLTKDTPQGIRQMVVLVRAVRPTKEELFTAGYDMDDFFLSPIAVSSPAARSPAKETQLASRRAYRIPRGEN